MSTLDTLFNYLRTAVVFVVVILFTFTVTYIPVPDRSTAHAQIPVPTPVLVVGSGPAEVVNTTLTGIMENTESILNGIAWAVAKQMIANMLTSTVDWINSGFEGSPAFIQDLDNFLLQAADEAVGTYLNEELGGVFSFICEPFRLDVRIALAAIYDQQREREQASCTVSGIFDNVTDFTEFITGDFERGGWDAWFELVSKPNQTPYGAVLEAEAELRYRIVNAKGDELTLAGWGDGFLSGKLCEPGDGPQSREVCQILKPGRVISDQLNKALGAGQDTLVEADQINEVVAALVGQIAQRAITGAAGLLGLSGGTGYTPYSRGSFTNEVRSGNNTISGAVDTGASSGDIGSLDILQGASIPLTNRLSQTLTAQQTFLAQIEGFTTDFEAIVADSRNSAFVIGQAQAALFEAATMRSQLNQQTGPAAAIVTDYIALENEYVGATPNRQGLIRLEQSQLIQNFTALGLPSESQINTTLARWTAIINLATASPTTPRGQCDSVQFDPDCERTQRP